MQLCADAGFRCFDFGIRSHIGSSFVYEDDWEKQAFALAESTQKLGCSYIQSHAPYAYSFYNDMEFYRDLTERSFRVAAILGAKQIVIHGLLRPDPTAEPDFDEDLRQAYEFYAPFTELAERLGIGIAVENLFNYGKKHIFTADVEEQLALIEKLGSECVSACWDIGHAHVRHGEDCLEQMKRLGSRISCTHIHDNLQSKDLHLPVFMGDIDWHGFMETLRQIQYSGDINFEIRVLRIPDGLVKEFLHFLYSSGKSLIANIG